MAEKKTKENVEIVPVENTAEALISQAITNKVDVGTMERLLAMRTQIKAEQAKEAYNRGMSAFQANCPTIIKTKEVTTRSGGTAYKYAPIESIVAQVKVLVKQHGFSYSFKQELKEAGVKVTCVIVHELGHSEEYSMEVPFGTKTPVMSDSQVTAAASTFAKRYAFCNAFGILTGDENNDGAKFDRSPVPDDAIPTVTYDDHEVQTIPSTHTPAWRQPKAPDNMVLFLKDKIKKLCDSTVMVELSNAKEYEDYVFSMTNLDLKDQTEPNLVLIVERLEAQR